MCRLLIVFVAVYVIAVHQRYTDRRTDGRTDVTLVAKSRYARCTDYLHVALGALICGDDIRTTQVSRKLFMMAAP